MNKKIRMSLTGVSVLCVLLTAMVLTLIFFNFYQERMYAAVDTEAELLYKTTVTREDMVDALESLRLTLRDARVTLIDADGSVLFDSYESIENMDNHVNREEVRAALASGRGTANRFSATLGMRTYYSAIRTDRGQVLRVARTMNDILGVFLHIVAPIVLVVLAVWIAGYFISARVTAWIINPINKIDVSRADRPVYEELSPFLRRISHQNEQISEQMELLKDRASTIQAIVDDMREGLIILSPKADILSVNTSALSIFGFQSAPGNLLELTRNMEIVSRARRAVDGESGDCVFETQGRVIQAYFSSVKHEHGDGAILFLLDITERANAEQIRREFSANVSHELKTPLTVIAGLSEMLCEGMAKGEDAIPFAEKIRTETSRLQMLIDDIIKLSELDETVDMETEVIDLIELAEDALNASKPLADEKEIDARVEGENVMMIAQRGLIYELFCNLINNGIKYNKQGGELVISIHKEGNRAHISVRDTGIGIPKDKLPRVFERFYRVDPSRSKQTGGTGLGLSIVKHIALIHGGTVEIDSEEGQYTEVALTLANKELKTTKSGLHPSSQNLGH